MTRPAGMHRFPTATWWLLALAIYAAAAVLLTWPLASHLTDHLIASPDSPLNAWILAWGTHALSHDPSRLFQANIFFPASDTLAFSDTLLGDQCLFAPVYAATGNPVLAYNLTLLGSFVLNGLSLALLARVMTGAALPALVAGFVHAFLPVRFPHLVHIQLLSAWWAPLAFLALHAWLREPRPSRMAGLIVAVWGQFLSSAYLGTMLAALLVPFALWRGWPDRRRLCSRRVLRDLMLAALLGAVLFLPVVIPYLRSQTQWGLERGLADQMLFSAQPTSFLAAQQENWLYGDLTRPFRRRFAPWETDLFFGLVPLGLALLGLVQRRRRGDGESGESSPHPRGYLLTGGLGLLLALGPILIWGDEPAQWPLPYLALFLWLPGFRAMRVPARFVLIAVVPLAVLAGVGTARLLAAIRRWTPRGSRSLAGVSVGLLLAGITLESWQTSPPLQRIQTLEAPASGWLQDAGRRGAILELPFRPLTHYQEALRMLRSTAHWAPMVNGYSGFLPRSYFELAALVNGNGLSGPVLDALEALGIRTLVIHLDELPEAERGRWLQDPPWSPRLALIRSGAAVRLYTILPSGARSTGLATSLMLPSMLSAENRFRVGLHLQENSGGPWVNPGPLGQQVARVTWTPASGSPPTERLVPIHLPVVLLAGQPFSTLLLLETPAAPGAYRVEVSGPGFRDEQTVRLVAVAPDVGAPRAEVAWLGLSPASAGAGGRLPLLVRIRNRGTGIWRESDEGSASGAPFRRLALVRGLGFWWASADLPEHGAEWRIWGVDRSALWVTTQESYFGRFSLRHRWLRDGQPVAGDFVPLPQDVFPGQALDLGWTVLAPPDPGTYELELTVQAPPLRPLSVSESGGTVRIPVEVRR